LRHRQPSQVSRLCGEVDGKIATFLDRPLEGDWPYVWLDAKVRQDGRIVSVAVIIAVGANTAGRREVLGMTIGAETFWTEFLRKLARRGLRGVKLVISDAHEGIKASVAKVLCATWQRCRVHFMRNVLAHAGKQGRRVVSAFIGTAFAQDDAAAARAQWRQVADQLRPRVQKLAALMDEAETDVLAYMDFPAAHRTKLHSTNPIERLNGEIKRRTDVVGIFPNEDVNTPAVFGEYIDVYDISRVVEDGALDEQERLKRKWATVEALVGSVNRPIKEATVKRYHYDSHQQFQAHLENFVSAYNFGRRLKTLKGLTPYEYICKIWTTEPERFKLDPIHQMPGLNT